METHATKAVFLSYASQDADVARRIAGALQALGVEVWFDRRELRGGDAWDQEIRRQIKECALFLPVISARTQARREGYFRLEWKLAAQRTHMMSERAAFLLPVVVDDTRDDAADVPDEFRAVQWTHLPGGEAAAAFVAHVKHLLAEPDPRVLPAPRATAPAGSAADTRAAAAPFPGDKSVAVLPFENRSDDKADAFFSDGIHEDILTSLANIRELRVVSRTSVMRFRDTTRPMAEIGRELGVAYILEGSVRRSGSQVRITGQLIHAATDEHVWARNYDRDLTARDVFAIQTAVSAEIAKALQAVLSSAEKAILERRPTENLAAYELYLKGRRDTSRSLPRRTELKESEQYLRQAVGLDPDFAEAWAELAVVHASHAFVYYDRTPGRLAQADAAIGRAVQLAPDAPEVIRLLGMYAFFGYRNYARATAQLEKVIRLQPNNSDAYCSLGMVQREQGRWLDSLENLRTATVLDPGSVYYSGMLRVTLATGRRWSDALAEQRRIVARLPDRMESQKTLFRLVYSSTGSTKDGDDWLSRLSPGEFESPKNIEFRKAWAVVKGDYAEWKRLDGIQPYFDEGGEPRYSQARYAATVIAGQGDLEGARARLGDFPAKLRLELENQPDNHDMLQDLGFMEALLGHREEALNHARKAVELMPESRSAIVGPIFRHILALVHAWTGDKDRAIAEITRLMRIPAGDPGVHHMRTDPHWAPLRGDPRWEALLNDPHNNAPLF